jgi:16S rRNA (cytosine1402-N4)-methyltransferase
MNGGHYHTPVLLREAIDALAIQPGGVYVDATLGGGGYSEEIAKKISSGRLYSFDTDPNATNFSAERLEKFKDHIEFVPENFRYLERELRARGVEKIDGIVYDLGISSRQIDTTSVGLSYRYDSELDMRLDPRLRRTAKEIIAEASTNELKHIFREYGEEPLAGRIAGWIDRERKKGPIETTVHLANIITHGIREDKRNATLARIFQALRIEVNDELRALEESLEGALALLAGGGRIVVVSYHSLEDRIVKNFFLRNAKPKTEAGTLKSLRMATDEESAALVLITRKPVTASAEEIGQNPRARSAKMRVAEKR